MGDKDFHLEKVRSTAGTYTYSSLTLSYMIQDDTTGFSLLLDLVDVSAASCALLRIRVQACSAGMQLRLCLLVFVFAYLCVCVCVCVCGKGGGSAAPSNRNMI